MKATAIAPSNIAFVKYWGRKNEEVRLPSNGSISMNLSGLTTTTTVEFDKTYQKDSIEIDGKQDISKTERVITHLDRIRNIAHIPYKAKVVSKNNFPSSTGLSSSASGFAALTVAGVKASGLNLSEKDMTILARFASGSACRSIPSGIVEWIEGNTKDNSFAYSLYPTDYWDLVDVVAILSSVEKVVPTTVGQICAYKSPFFDARLSRINQKIELCKKLIKEKNFLVFGEMVEQEALELHAVMMTSVPPLLYLLPQTVLLMQLVREWRSKGLPAYFTLNTGQNIHIICEKKTMDILVNKLKSVPQVSKTIVNFSSEGARLSQNHLF